MGARPGLRAVADEDEDERELDHLRVQAGRRGHQHGPVQRLLLAAGQVDEVEVAQHRPPEGQRDADRADQDVLPRGLDRGLRHVQRDEHGRRDRGRLDGDPHEADVVRGHGEQHREGEEVAEDAEPPGLRRRRSRRPRPSPARARPPARPPRSTHSASSVESASARRNSRGPEVSTSPARMWRHRADRRPQREEGRAGRSSSRRSAGRACTAARQQRREQRRAAGASAKVVTLRQCLSRLSCSTSMLSKVSWIW